jgi:TRAP-type C4-dicarboxylate transport system substrate-binding protein
MELTVNLSSSEQLAKIYVDALNRISERTGGKVTFVIYYSNSLMAPTEALDGLGSGLADISDVTLTNFPDRFVYTQQVVSYPFLGFTSLPMAADVMNDVIFNNQLMMDEFKAANITPMFFVGVWGTSIMLKNKIEVSTPDTVKGLKLITADPVLSKLLADQGATPVNQPPTEYFNSMSNNVVDGIVHAIFVADIFGALELCKNVYMFENSFATGARAICINNDTWNKFDDTLKQIFMDEWQGEEFWNSAVPWWAMQDQMHLDNCAKWGIPVNQLTGDAMQAWRDAAKPYGDANLKALYDKGYTEVYKVLDVWKQAISSYSGKY